MLLLQQGVIIIIVIIITTTEINRNPSPVLGVEPEPRPCTTSNITFVVGQQTPQILLVEVVVDIICAAAPLALTQQAKGITVLVRVTLELANNLILQCTAVIDETVLTLIVM